MIRFFWKYRYQNLFIILLTFILSVFSLKNLKVFFESERIIELSNVEKDIIEKSLDDKNLILVGLEFTDSLSYENLVLIKSQLKLLDSNQSIQTHQSIFNEKEIIYSSFVPITISLLDISSKKKYLQSVEKIKKFNSNFITKDFKNLLFVIKCKNLNTENEKEDLLKFLESHFAKYNSKNIFSTGQIKSEIYMQENVVNEMIYFTISSFILCSLILWFYVRNIYLVIINIISIVLSILFSFNLSNFLFGGIELVMIIIPAVIFIITISDYMHLLNSKQKFRNKFRLFRSQMQYIGKPVFLTSATTAIGFLSFTFVGFDPLMRFGLITTISIFISLFIIVTLYSLCVDLDYLNRKKEVSSVNKIIVFFSSLKKYQFPIILVFILLSFMGLFNISINNFLTDEINKKSPLYKEISYFDNVFGGIKPLTFNASKNNSLNQLKDELSANNLNIDFIYNENERVVVKTRMQDKGTIKSNMIYDNILKKFDLKIGGVGFLFDKISNQLTKEVLLGLVFAIIVIGIFFVVFNNFNLNYFIVSLIPNIIPLLTCLGLLSFSDFYFSLSNAFIFAIVFGLIVDDSIHIISAYSNCRKRNLSIEKSINFCKQNTYQAVIKTTIVIIVSLLPLLFSEFKSISQLAYITIISAIVAIVFDLIYLPKLLKRFIK
tara:strand:+ start:1636 stop:3618 length:1983 start_codon:yes stop_codon:yes gene_type:complete